MEAGTTVLADGTVKSTDLIDVMYATADDNVSDEELLNYEKTVCRPAAPAPACSPPTR